MIINQNKGPFKKYVRLKIAKISPPSPLVRRLNRKITTFYSDGTHLTDPPPSTCVRALWMVPNYIILERMTRLGLGC